VHGDSAGDFLEHGHWIRRTFRLAVWVGFSHGVVAGFYLVTDGMFVGARGREGGREGGEMERQRSPKGDHI